MSWNLINASKQQVIASAKTLQAAGQPGDFIIRAGVSAEVAGALGITLVSSRGKLLNYLIDPTRTRELQVRGSDASFRTAEALVEYYAERKRHPLPVQLNVDAGQEETFGFGSDSDDSAVKYDDANVPTSPVYGSIAAAGGPPDALTINMLRKQAELLAARRRAAEVNVKLLAAQNIGVGSPQQQRKLQQFNGGGGGGGFSGDGGGGGSGSAYNTLSRAGMSQSQLSNMQSESRAQAEVQMADMQNAGLLAGWKAQLAELDRLRSLSPEGGQLMEQIEQQRRERILKIEAMKGRSSGAAAASPGGGGSAAAGGGANGGYSGAGSMSAVADPSVSRLYDDIGVYTTRAKAAREAEVVIEKEESVLLAEEMQLREEELKLQRESMIVANIAKDIQELIFGIADEIVMSRTIEDDRAQERAKQADLEGRLAEAESDRQDKERRLHEIGSMMRPLAGILSAPQGAYGQAGPSYGGPSMATYEQLQRPSGKLSWKQQQQQQQQGGGVFVDGGGGGQVQYGGAPPPQTNQWWKHGRTAPAPVPVSSAPRRSSYDRRDSFEQPGSPPRRASYEMQQPQAHTGSNFNSYGGGRRGSQNVSPQGPARSWNQQRRGSAQNGRGGGGGDLYARIPGDASSDEDAPTAPAWKRNLQNTRGGGGVGRRYSSDRLPEPPAAFSVVKYAQPGGRGGGANDFDGGQDEECTHLGNCTCPNCR